MKRICYKIITSLCVFCIIATAGINGCASEQPLSLTAVFDPQTHILAVSGASVENVVITVTEESVSYEQLYDGQPTEFQYIKPSAGKYAFNFDLSQAESGKKYIVSATTRSEMENTSFLCYSYDDAQVFFEQNLSGKPVEEFSRILSENGPVFGFNYEEAVYEQSGEQILKILYAFNSKDAKKLIFDYTTAWIYAQLANSAPEETEALLSKYAAQLGIDYETDWAQRVADELKPSVLDAISKSDYTLLAAKKEQSFSDWLKKQCALVDFTQCESWLSLQKLITEKYVDLFSEQLSSSDYRKVQEKDSVYSDLIRYHEKFDSLEAIQELLADSAARQLKKETKPASSSGGGGSGGGKSSAVMAPISVDKDFIAETPVIKPQKQFADVSKEHWCSQDILKLTENNMIDGYEDGTFHPDAPVSRSEFVKLLIAVCMQTEEEPYESQFSDVKVSDWFAPYIAVALKQNLILGDGAYFYPNTFITREDAAVICYRAVADQLAESVEESVFPDRDDISDYAVKAVQTLQKNQIISGMENGFFCPKQNITRAESVHILCGLLELKKGGINKE